MLWIPGVGVSPQTIIPDQDLLFVATGNNGIEIIDLDIANSISIASANVDVEVKINSAPTGEVTIDGDPTQNVVLSANTSTVQDEDGLGEFVLPVASRRGQLIPGANSSTHTLTQVDVGTQISVRVDYTDNEGTAERLTSAQTPAVANVNDAPVLDPSASPQLSAINEDAGMPVGQVGTLVSDLIDAGGTHNNFSDADGDLPGIAITGTNLQGGTLYYSTDDGATWQLVSAVTPSSSLTLLADSQTRIYFSPGADLTNEAGGTFTFRAWDRTGASTNGEQDVLATSTLSLVGNTGHIRIFFGNAAVSDDETRLFVADEWTGDLRVFDITNPVSPVQLGAYRLNLPLRVQTTSDPDLIYVADRSGDNPPLTVLDISNPSNIQAIKSLGTSNAGRKVILDEVSNKAYLCHYQGIDILDITDLRNPLVLDTIPVAYPGAVDAVIGEEGIVYFGLDEIGILVVDVDAEAPTVIKTISLDGPGRKNLLRNGDTLYLVGSLAGDAYGMMTFDISEPTNPGYARVC
jgi:hypothetical protein